MFPPVEDDPITGLEVCECCLPADREVVGQGGGDFGTRQALAVGGRAGFGQSFVLDIAALRRHDIVLDIAFGAAKEALATHQPVERLVRRRAAETFRKKAVIPGLIDAVKTLMGPEDEPESEG
jgi:hypothetical protein